MCSGALETHWWNLLVWVEVGAGKFSPGSGSKRRCVGPTDPPATKASGASSFTGAGVGGAALEAGVGGAPLEAGVPGTPSPMEASGLFANTRHRFPAHMLQLEPWPNATQMKCTPLQDC